MDTLKRTDGFALPAAIFALVVVGVLVTGGFFVARQESRIGVAQTNSAAALYMAERGIADVVSDPSVVSGLAVWDTMTVHDTLDDGVVDVEVTRAANRLFFLDATIEVTRGGIRAGAARRLGLMARFFTANIDPPAALTTQGTLKYGGSSEVHGLDEIPDGSSGGLADWTGICDPSAMVDKPGILIDDTTNINWNGNRNKIEGNMTGDPLFDEDPSITFESLMQFGDMSWDDLVSLAEKVYTSDPGLTAPVTDGVTCTTTVKDNWGDPINQASPCANYFPIIYYAGTDEMGLHGGVGQGILLVEGDLRVNGGFEFYGPVFVKGTLTTNGSGGHFWGGVIAGNADLETTTVLGNAVITYSSCAIERALLNNSSLTRLRPLASRSWVDLSNVSN